MRKLTSRELEFLKTDRFTRHERYARNRRIVTEQERLIADKRYQRIAFIGRECGYNMPDWIKSGIGPKAAQYRRLIDKLALRKMSPQDKQVLQSLLQIKVAHSIMRNCSDYDEGLKRVQTIFT